MEHLLQYLPFIIPIVLVQLVLMVIALVHILRHDQYRWGNRVIWILVVLFLQLLGPILYFILGKKDAE